MPRLHPAAQVIHDAVRPVTAIQHIFAGEAVTATVRGEGVKEVPGREWQSYLRTMPVRRGFCLWVGALCGWGLVAAGSTT